MEPVAKIHIPGPSPKTHCIHGITLSHNAGCFDCKEDRLAGIAGPGVRGARKWVPVPRGWDQNSDDLRESSR